MEGQCRGKWWGNGVAIEEGKKGNGWGNGGTMQGGIEGKWSGNGRGKEGEKSGKAGTMRGGGEWRGRQFRVAQTSTLCLATCEDFNFFAIQYRG